MLTSNKASTKNLTSYTIDDLYNEQKIGKEKEINRILEKIHKKGISSLSTKEKDILEKYSAKKQELYKNQDHNLYLLTFVQILAEIVL